MTELNAVHLAIRDHVATAYPAWRSRAADPVRTRSGARYRGLDVATLLTPVLVAVGLHVWDDYEARLFVTRTGRQIARDTLRDLLLEALAEHEDTVLRASIGSAIWEHIADRMPCYEGDEIERLTAPASRSTRTSADHARAYRDRRRENETASALAFLRALVEKGIRSGERIPGPDLYASAKANIARKVEEARTGYGSPYITDADDSALWTVPGRSLFYSLADEVLGPRKRAARGYVWEIARKAVRRLTAWRKRPLSPETEETLRSLAALVRGAATEEPAPRRTRWRDRPLDPETEAALRGLSEHLNDPATNNPKGAS